MFDILAHLQHGDVRRLPWIERRHLLLDTVGPLGPPIQPVPATDDPEVALHWYETLRPQGIEGIIAKPANSLYRAARIWRKLRNRKHGRRAAITMPDRSPKPLATAG